MWHWVDLAILAIIGLSVITGLIRGFIKELIALAVWILAFWLAFNYSQSLDPWLHQYIQDSSARLVTGFILIFVGTLISGGIINALLGFLLKRSGLSGTDRILGMGFGFIRGLFLVALIIVVIQLTSLPHLEYSSKSKLYVKFDPLVNWLTAAMPDFIKQAKFLDRDSKPKVIPEQIGQSDLINLANDFEFSDG
ncbi:MAG: CvpA family protein [Tatlockia sp.]|nr:CvpA family protein [Tatlockia sp.]